MQAEEFPQMPPTLARRARRRCPANLCRLADATIGRTQLSQEKTRMWYRSHMMLVILLKSGRAFEGAVARAIGS